MAKCAGGNARHVESVHYAIQMQPTWESWDFSFAMMDPTT